MKRFVGALGVAIPTYMVYKHQTDEGFRRATRLYSVAGPVVLAYRFTELKHQMMTPKSQEASDAEWAALDEEHSETILDLLNELQGMFIKYGQTGAGLTNTLSKTWIEKLRTLEDNCRPQPKEVVYDTITEA